MSIECYYQWCRYHCANYPPFDDGPFCTLDTCVAPRSSLDNWAQERARMKQFILSEDDKESD